MAFKTLSGFLESLFYMLFLEGHFVNFWNLQMCINLTVSAASLNFFSGFGFCNFSSFAFGTNCTTHVNSSWELDNTWQFRKKWGVKRQIVFFAWMIKYFGKVPRKGFVKVLWQISILFLIYKEIPEDTQISCDSWHFKKDGNFHHFRKNSKKFFEVCNSCYESPTLF